VDTIGRHVTCSYNKFGGQCGDMERARGIEPLSSVSKAMLQIRIYDNITIG